MDRFYEQKTDSVGSFSVSVVRSWSGCSENSCRRGHLGLSVFGYGRIFENPVGLCKKSKILGNTKKYYIYMGDSKKIDFEVREISDTDLQRGFFDALSNLTEVGKISEEHENAMKVLHEIRSYPFYKVFVAVKKDGEIIGSNTLLIERKFIHNGGRVGHIEDVATKKGYEGMGIGRALVGRSLRFAEQMKCYKVILDCSEKNVPFYKKIGFKEYGLSMRYDLL